MDNIWILYCITYKIYIGVLRLQIIFIEYKLFLFNCKKSGNHIRIYINKLLKYMICDRSQNENNLKVLEEFRILEVKMYNLY